MKISYITHACILIQIGKINILTDPWLCGPCWGGSLWHYPQHKFTPRNLPTPDVIFFSHGHDDHYHKETIDAFPKSWKKSLIIAPKFNEEWWENELSTKFKKIKFFKHNETFKYNDSVSLQVFKNDLGEYDSSLKISSVEGNIFLQTDNLFSNKEAKRIARLGKIDFLFALPYLTGVYPGFYKMDPKKLIEESKKKSNNSLQKCLKTIKLLNPKYTIPYACDVGYLGENFHVNFIHSNNKLELVKISKKIQNLSEIKLLSPGDYIHYKDSKIFNEKISKYSFNKAKLIKFFNENNNKYLKFKKKEVRLSNKTKLDAIKVFYEKLKNNLPKKLKTKFIVKIRVYQNTQLEKIIIINLNKSQIFINENQKKIGFDLNIDIQKYKIANLIEKRYPMNFLTFHNGGYICERKNNKLSKPEIFFWNWIENLQF
jgi:L-ascorbate metabolism protein UlaG (beta-lactamase superfamily)